MDSLITTGTIHGGKVKILGEATSRAGTKSSVCRWRFLADALGTVSTQSDVAKEIFNRSERRRVARGHRARIGPH
jgi:hypothetical protein